MGTIIAKSSRRSDCPPTDPKGFGACERCLPPLAIFPKKGQAFSPESVVRSRFRAFLPHFCVDLRGFSAITEPSDRPRHLCDPAERPKNLQAATNLRPETTFRNSAIHLTRIKFSQKKSPAAARTCVPQGFRDFLGLSRFAEAARPRASLTTRALAL